MNIYICIKDSFRQVDTLAIGEMLSVFEPIHRRVGIGTGKFLAWIIGKGVAPHITVRDQSLRDDGTFSRSLSQWVRANRQGLDVILVGNPTRAADAAAELCESGPTLSKPYEPQVVVDRIRRLLAERALRK